MHLSADYNKLTYSIHFSAILKTLITSSKLALLIVLALLTGCGSQFGSVRDVGQYNQLPENFASLPTDVQGMLLDYAGISVAASQHWGKEFRVPTSKAYIKYLDDYQSRSIVDFNQGQINIETLASSEPKKALQQAIITTLLTPSNPNQVEIFNANDVKFSGKPFLLGRVVDHEGKEVRYMWRAKNFAKYLVNNRLAVAMTPKGNKFSVVIPMVKEYEQIGAQQFSSHVQRQSRRFGVAQDLIYSIMETESSFNPYAVSSAPAYGLMQIVPSTAGRDVFKRIKGIDRDPTKAYLFKPANNIEAGTAYLSILRDIYLKDITNPISKEYCIISAYNGGAGNVLKTFSSNRKAAPGIINSMSPSEVYKVLRYKHPSEESRRYLEKVTQNQRKWQKI